MQYFYKDLIWKWRNNLNLTACFHSWVACGVESTTSRCICFIDAVVRQCRLWLTLTQHTPYLFFFGKLFCKIRLESLPVQQGNEFAIKTWHYLFFWLTAITRPSFSQRSVDKHDSITTFFLITDWCICWLSSYKNEFWGKMIIGRVEIQMGMFPSLKRFRSVSGARGDCWFWFTRSTLSFK